MENSDNKKALILSVIGILVLIIAVVGVSFAMFTFTGTGTKENIIKTGTVTIDFTDSSNNFELKNTYPMSDLKGIKQTDNKATFGIKGDWTSSPMTIIYDLGLINIVQGSTLTNEYVKIALLDSNGKVLVGEKDDKGNLKSGVTVASLEKSSGVNKLFKEFALTSGTLTTSGVSDTYTIIAYVSDKYDLPTEKIESEGETKVITKAESYSFKIGIKAKQQ